MKILYVAPRYHTNQIPIMDGWLKNNHQVLFVSQVTNSAENHEILTPVVLGYSVIFNFFFTLINKVKKRTLADELFAASSKKGFPPYFKLKKIIKEFAPDVAVLRERSVYTAVAYHICAHMKIPAILYNQSPYWETPDQKRSKLKREFSRLFPRVRMTPVRGVAGDNKICEKGSYYVPFVMWPYCTIDEKIHFKDGKIQIICVAGYHDRKRLPLLLEATAWLKSTEKIHLCIVGEVITEDQQEYYNYISEYVGKLGIRECVTLLKNCSRAAVFERYRESDLFVLPSTRERASISQLEAMSCALPVICSDTNGASFQVETGVNGYLFQDESLEDLKEKLKMAVSDRERLIKMGQAGYDFVCERYGFEAYYQGICRIVDDIQVVK